MEALYKVKVASPYDILEIEDIKIKFVPNEHGYLYIRCLIDDIFNEKYSLEASTNDEIKIYEETNDSEGTSIIFNGVVDTIATINNNGVYYLEIEASTLSLILDIEEKSRSFQDTEMTYDELISEILKDYRGFGYTYCINSSKKICNPLFQYKETDFEFLKRIASYIGININCDIINKNNLFYFGSSYKKEIVINEDIPYKSHLDIASYNKAKAERNLNISSIEYMYYEIKTNTVIEAGTSVYFKNAEFYVYSYKAEYINGELLYIYRLCRKNAIWQEKIYNNKLKGISLEGKVLDVSSELVKLHLNIDKEQDILKAAWFRYAPPTGNVMYSMPIVGTNARLYFSNEMSNSPIVTGCVRTNGSTCEQFSDTSNRYFATESDNHIDMLKGAVNFSRPGLSINLNDDDGISLISSSSLYAGAGDIILDAGKISITAKEKVTIDQNNQSTLSLENECYTDASGIVYENGSCRETFEPFTDDDPILGAPLGAAKATENACLAGVAEGVNAQFSKLGDENISNESDNSSIPLEGEELEKRTDIEVYDSKKSYKGEYVKTQAGDDTWILGKAYPNGTGSVFVPENPNAAIEHTGTFLNHLKTFGYSVLNTGIQTLDDIKILGHYICAVLDYKNTENYFSHINSLKEEKERTNKNCKDKSPYKAAYEADNSILNIVMAVQGIGSLFSSPKSIFSIGESISGGIKIVGSSEAIIDISGISGLALEGLGSLGGSVVGALEAGAGIYNMSEGSSGSSDSDPELMNWDEFQKAHKGEFKTDDDGLARDKMIDAWEKYKKEHYPNEGEHTLHRPNIRKGTKDNIKYEYKTFIDEKTGKAVKRKVDPNKRDKILVEGEIDIGHKTGHEYARCRDAAESLGWNQSQFNEFMNNPDFYQWEDHASNISHAYENKNKELEDLIEEMSEFAQNGLKWK